MRWLLLFAVVVLGAAVAWAVWAKPEPSAEPVVSNPQPAPVRALPRDDAGVVERASAIAALSVHAEAEPPARDAGMMVAATFEVWGDNDRVPGTRITLDRGTERYSSLADAMGIAHLEIPAGKWEASCSNDCAKETLDVIPSVTRYRLQLRKPQPISGVVVDAMNVPVSNAQIIRSSDWNEDEGLWPEPESRRPRPTRAPLAITNTIGEFTFEIDQPDVQFLAVKGDRHSVVRRVAGPARDLKLVLFAFAPVEFHLSGGERLSWVAVSSVVSQLPFTFRVLPPRDYERLPVGHHQATLLQRTTRGLFSAIASFEVVAGQRNLVDVHLSASPGMRVTVTDGRGQPIAGATVICTFMPSEADPPKSTRMVRLVDGGFELSNLDHDLDLESVTGADGSATFTPTGTSAAPLYRVTAKSLSQTSDSRLMRLGGEPITIEIP